MTKPKKGKATPLRKLAGRENKPAKKKGKKLKALDPKADFEEPVRKPRQARIPGMEDNAIKDLEDAAIEHSEIRSEIVANRARLKDSETRVAALMKTNGKKTYNHNGIHLKLREGHDSVSVQVKRHDREDPPEPDAIEPEQEQEPNEFESAEE